MKYLVLLAFLPFAAFAQSNQQMLNGVWVKVKAQMKDGSRVVDHNGCGMDFLKYNFTPDGFVNRSTDPLFDGFKLPYKITGDSLVVGGTVFNIVSFTKDTLKLSFFAPGVEDSQLPVYYFTRALERNTAGTATFNAAIKDSVYQATNEFFPWCKGDIFTLMRIISGEYEKGSFKASFIIDKKGRVKNYTLISVDSVSNGFAKQVCRDFGNVDWKPAAKNGVPVSSIVQLTFRTKRAPYGGTSMMMNNMQIEYDFLPKAPYPQIDRDDFETAQKYFKDAINQSNGGNYDKAVELLTKCIEIDNIDLGAYTFRALINARLGKTADACKDWATLAAYGQLDGAKKLAKFCKK